MNSESASSSGSSVEVLDVPDYGLLESSSTDSSMCGLNESSSSSSSSLKSELLTWKRGSYNLDDSIIDDPPWYISALVKLSCFVMFLAGLVADWLRMRGFIKVTVATDDPRHKGFAPLDDHLEAVYINHIYRKSSDVVNRPICSVPASVMRLKDRYTDDNGWTQKHFTMEGERYRHLKTFAQEFLAGGASAAIARTITAPIDRVKILLQLQQAQVTIAVDKRYKGIFNCFTRVVREQGPLALWRGNWINVVRIFPQQAFDFAFRDAYQKFFLRGVDKRKQFWRYFLGNLASGGAAGGTSLIIIYPLDFARTRLATDIGKETNREFKGFSDCIRKIVKTDGVAGLYRGFISSIQGIILYRAFYFGFFDTITGTMVKDKKKLGFFHAWLIGQFTVVTSGLICYPWDTVRRFTGTETEVINMGSYNYLGFSHNDGPCAEEALRYIDKYGLHIGSTRHERGNHKVQAEVEKCVAHYLGVEAAICFPMGFGTNSMNIPSLVDKGSLILSDKLNHASLVLGCRVSGATVKVFKHNDAKDCEKKLRNALCHPSPKTGKPYNKILIVIEGIYSMEGTIVNLPEFINIKKKYKAYLFLDEAHSVGALGPTGKGVVEYWGCNARDVDVMMGTLTKSFAAAGGYMGGTKSVIDHIRRYSAGPCYGAAMSPPIIAQVLSSMKVMCGDDGTNTGARKAVQLLRNSRYFRRRLKQMGFLIYGHEDSPVVPLMTFYITKVVEFSRRTLKYDVGLVAVGFPATPLTKARVRFCLSADHTKEQLDYVLDIVDQVGDALNTKYGTKCIDRTFIEY